MGLWSKMKGVFNRIGGNQPSEQKTHMVGQYGAGIQQHAKGLIMPHAKGLISSKVNEVS